MVAKRRRANEGNGAVSHVSGGLSSPSEALLWEDWEDWEESQQLHKSTAAQTDTSTVNNV